MHSNANPVPQLPSGQRWIIERMKALEYPSSDFGICIGIAYMGMQAIFADDEDNFYRRLQLAHSIPVDEFKNKIDELKQKRLALITAKKKQAIKLFNQLEAAEKIKFENSDYFQKKLAALNETFNKLASENIRLDNSEKERRRAELLYNAFIQSKIDDALNQLDNDERLLLEIPAFFEGIELYVDPNRYAELFDSNVNATQLTTPGMKIAQSKMVEEHNEVIKINEFTGIYDINVLNTMLATLNELTQKTSPPLEHPFTLVLMNYNHVVLLKYNPDQINKWSYLDANSLRYFKHHIPDVNAATAVVTKLSSNDITTFATRVYARKSDEQQVNEIITRWQQHPYLQAIHKPTYHKAMLQDSYSATWLYIAARNNDIKRVNEILSLGVNPNIVTKNLTTPLYVAAMHGHIQIVRLLIHHKADVNAMSISKTTPLYQAVLYNHIDIISVLLKAGANPNIVPNHGFSPLHIALLNNNLNIAKLLLAYNANTDSITPDGISPFFIAAYKGQHEIIQLMLLNNNIDTTKSYQISIDHLKQLAKANHIEAVMTQFINQSTVHEGKVSITASQIATMMGKDDVSYLINQHQAKKSNYFSSEISQLINEEITRAGNKDMHYTKTLTSLRNAIVQPDNVFEFINDIINNQLSTLSKPATREKLFSHPNPATYPFIEQLKRDYGKSVPWEVPRLAKKNIIK